jgi:acyl-CoA synthetase (AMP-forming)/AMP-acid ligase II
MNMGLHLTRAAQSFAERNAITDKKTRITYRTFNEDVNRLAHGMMALGLKKGDRAAMLSLNCHQLLEAFYACFKIGVVAVPFNSRVSMEEIVRMLNHAEASALFIGPEFVDRIDSLITKIKPVQHYIAFLSPSPSMLAYEEFFNYSEAEPGIDVGLEDLAELRYTSGTTGVMKAAMLPHRSLLAKARKHMLVPGIQIEIDSTICHVAPVTHASGGWVLPFISRGGCNALLPRFDARTLLETIERERVTHLFVVPTMLRVMMDYQQFSDYDISSIRTIVYGASPMPPKQIKRAIEMFGPVFVQGYGQSETGSGFIFLHKEDHVCKENPVNLKRLTSVGLPSFECDVKLVDNRDREVQCGEVGEIVQRGPGNMIGYWKDPALTAEIMKDNWIHTGDMAYADENGYIYIVDRKSDMIISGGFNIFPAEVEKILNQHEAVTESAVIGIPDDKWGEAIQAFIVLKPGSSVTEQEILEFSKTRITGYKNPKHIIFVKNLPKDNHGKIQRRSLKERYWAGQDRMVH